MKFLIFFHLLAILFSFSLFLRGFFPLKQVSKGYASQKIRTENFSTTSPPSHSADSSQITTHSDHHGSLGTRSLPYSRTILMIIDAFRADFAYGPFNYMPQAHSILRAGHGVQFTAQTHPPTVTLPRIKAITTGSTPSFVDVVLNFGSPALEEDNIVTQMKMDERSIVFFGDDTWMRLFPEHFDRSDGTTSFFVSDYTEVDTNVTRHLEPELSNPSWDVMILHYLGLDHIGHTAGPSSPLIKPKLAEMDDVIQQIYSAMEQWSESSLLVVCGDHGMSDQGGHGGASPGEVSVPVLFLSPNIVNKDIRHAGSISQIDLCPTLSVLMGLPIPKNNLGKVITEALVGFSSQEKVSIIQQNAEQAMEILRGYVQDLEKESSYMLYQRAEQQLHWWHSKKESTPVTEWEEEGYRILTMYSESLTLLAEKIGRVATQYDVYAMAIAILLLWMVFASLVLSHLGEGLSSPLMPIPKYATQGVLAVSAAAMSHITMCTCGVPSDLMCQATPVSIGIQIGAVTIFLISLLHIFSQWSACLSFASWFRTWKLKTNFVEAFLVVGTVTHTFTLLSSSFVEEEHQTFYFLTTTVHLLLLAQLIIGMLVHQKHRQTLNFSGQKAYHCDSGRYGKLLHKDIKRDGNFSTVSGYPEELLSNHSDTVTNIDSASSIDYSESFPISDHRQRSCPSQETSPHLPPCTDNYADASQRKSLTEGIRSLWKEVKLRGNSDGLSLNKLMHFSASIVLVLIILRVLRRWNQTGNKWLDVPDIGDWMILPQNKSYLTMMVVFAMMVIGVTRGLHLKRIQSMCINLSLTTTYFYRVAGGSLYFPSTWFLSSRGILEARASFFFIGMAVFISLLPASVFRLEASPDKRERVQSSPDTITNVSKKNSLNTSAAQPRRSNISEQTTGQKCTNQESSSLTSEHKMSTTVSYTESVSAVGTTNTQEEDDGCFFTIHQRLRGITSAFLCFMCLVMRPHNTPLVALLSLVEQMMTPVLMQVQLQPPYILLYCLWMGQAFFFFQGNSNSLSTLDLTTGYTGLYEYVPSVTGCLLCVATYAGIIFWILTYIRIMCQMQSDEDSQDSKTRLSVVLASSCNTLLLTRALPLSVYTVLVSAQRYHLFVWTVFSPKLLYEGINTVVTALLAFLLNMFSWLKI